MLQPIYKRDLNHNYLILQGNDVEETYEIKMVLENEIEGLLKAEARFVNGRVDYYYEISSKQPISRFFSKIEISYAQLKQLILGIDQLMLKAKEYLLSFEHFVLEPEFIYCATDTFSLHFLFNPQYNKSMEEAFLELAEYILERVNHQEERAVFLAYQFYKIVKKENFVWTEVLNLLSENTSGEVSDFREEDCCDLNEEKFYQVEDEKWESREDFYKYQKGGSRIKKSEDDRNNEADSTNRMNNLKRKNRKIYLYFGVCVFISAVVFSTGMVIRYLFDYAYTESILLMGVAGIIFASGIAYLMAKVKKKDDVIEQGRNYEQSEIECQDIWKQKNANRQIVNEEILYEKQEEIESNQNLLGMNWNSGNTVLLGTMGVMEQRILKGKVNGKEVVYSLENLPLTIGKMPQHVDIVIADDSISRMHARFFEKEGSIYLEDLNSTNGTYKNGILLEANEVVLVEPEDEIQLAKFHFTYY